MSPELSAQQAKQKQDHPLFAGKTWKWSPEPWPLIDSAKEWMDDLGQAARSFYRALDLLYRKSWSGKSILRNQDIKVPWVADYYDAGKPDWLIQHMRSEAVRSSLPLVIRPDLLPTSDGIVLTEWDAVPGGIGLTANLEEAYGIHREQSMVDTFGAALVDAAKGFGGSKANMIIAVSDEAETYLPEMQWLSRELQAKGLSIDTCNPNELIIKDNALWCKGKQVQLVYRFWELFDHENIKCMRDMAGLVEKEKLVVTPPMKPVQEEKLSLALYHHPRLAAFWAETLSKKEQQLLNAAIPRTWIIDPSSVPPGAYLDGPSVQGKLLTDWSDLGQASKKERALVLKASGFHETAWGARSVVIGEDVPTELWAQALSDAKSHFPAPIYVLQEYKKPSAFEHLIFREDGSHESERGRVRLSPYYFLYDNSTHWRGTLAAFCPADKKIIHGMKDGSLMPAC